MEDLKLVNHLFRLTFYRGIIKKLRTKCTTLLQNLDNPLYLIQQF